MNRTATSTMQIQALGHVVLKVRNLERSVAFYRDILGMKEVARLRNTMVFFSIGDNHQIGRAHV